MLNTIFDFVSWDDTRPSLQTPWIADTVIGRRIIATDAKVIILVDPEKASSKILEFIRSAKCDYARPDVDASIEPLTRKRIYANFPDVAFKTVVEECGFCKSHPTNRAYCQDCFGSGKEYKLNPEKVRIGGRNFKSENVEPVLALPGVHRMVYEGEGSDKYSPVAFKFAYGSGLVMPLTPRHNHGRTHRRTRPGGF